MCGIGGTISRNRELGPIIPLIISDQKKRGPDFSSHVSLSAENLEINLAHNRLAILDLTDESNQPFVDPKTGACIVFNGEIYNYKEIREQLFLLGDTFQTTGDTEVLLKAFLRWGNDVFNKLNGMFAFAVWSPKTQTLTMGRDRFGVKPCYYVYRDGQLAFASNTTALARFFKLSNDYEYLAHGLIYNLYEDAEGSSPFEEICSLPPGHFLEFQAEKLRIQRWYNLAEAVETERERIRSFSDEQILTKLEERLRSAVQLRLRSDVPVTISLSGGLDSALLASLSRVELRRELEAFTFGTLDDPRSEALLATESADRLGIKMNYVDAPIKDLPEIFERTLKAQGAPFAHPSVMAQNRVFEEMHKKGYRVSLGGQGADEGFMGYRKFQIFYLRDLIRRRQWLSVPGVGMGIMALLASDVGGLQRLLLYKNRYSKATENYTPFRGVKSSQMKLGIDGYKNLSERQIADVGFASLCTLLRYEDRNSMGHSVESRMPYLDYRVMELGLALPNRLKIRRGYGKWILRRMADNRLPPQIINNRSKAAFSMDASEWLNGSLGEYIRAGIQPRISSISNVLSDRAIEILKNDSSYFEAKYFPLLVTGYWLANQA